MQHKQKKNDRNGKNLSFMEFVMNISRPIYLQQLINRMNNGMIKIVTGLRRCGKSYLLLELFREYLLSAGVKDENIIGIGLDRFSPPLQSAFNLATPEKDAQERRPFQKVNDSFKKIIPVRDNIKIRRDKSGIVTMGILDFLLNPNSLAL